MSAMIKKRKTKAISKANQKAKRGERADRREKRWTDNKLPEKKGIFKTVGVLVGYLTPREKVKCAKCHGNGVVFVVEDDVDSRSGVKRRKFLCWDCKGRGFIRVKKQAKGDKK